VAADPHNVDAEESVLGSMMLDKRAIEICLEVLEPDGETRFYRESHGLIYRACRGLHQARRPVDAITVAELLEQRGLLDAVKSGSASGRARIQEIATLVPATSSAGAYAKIVLERWRHREVDRALRMIDETHYDSAEEKLRAAEETLG
jgi:replicative DNA helicase